MVRIHIKTFFYFNIASKNLNWNTKKSTKSEIFIRSVDQYVGFIVEINLQPVFLHYFNLFCFLLYTELLPIWIFKNPSENSSFQDFKKISYALNLVDLWDIRLNECLIDFRNDVFLRFSQKMLSSSTEHLQSD